jgi:magnesium transporter
MSVEQTLVRAFASDYPAELARLVEVGSSVDFARLLTELPSDHAAVILENAMPLAASGALQELPSDHATSILLALDPRVAASILRRLPQAERERLLAVLPRAAASTLRSLTAFGPKVAGGHVDPRAPSVVDTLSVEDALDRVRAHAEGALHYVYAVDSAHRLTGVVNMRELMLAPREAPLGAIMTKRPDALSADTPVQLILSHPAWRRVHALPVVDGDGRFLGVLRYSTFRALEAELGKAQSGPDAGQTAMALAELYAVGASALTHWVGVSIGSRNRSEET